MDRRVLPAWIGWLLALVVITIVMRSAREEMTQAHVVLVFLLAVIGGSVSGGRALGFFLAFAGFVLIDYYFQPPFDTLTVDKSLDWIVLLAFLAVAGATTQLLTRARQEAAAATRRATEVASLARLGAETLSLGRAEDALVAIAEVIRTTLGVSDCEIYRWDGTHVRETSPPRERSGTVAPWLHPDLVERVARLSTETPVALDEASLTIVPADTPDAHTILIPLRGHDRVVGVLRVSDRSPLGVDQKERRFLAALAYYSTLGIERVELVAEVEHAEALREADRLRDVVVASISHDLRTPLTAIKALAQEGAAQGDRTAAAIEEQTDYLSRLVGDLLDWSRLKAGAVKLAPEFNTAEDLLGTVTRQFAGTPGAGVMTTIDLSQPALAGTFDFVQTARILTNLVENAIRHSPRGAVVELGVDREGDRLRFTVADRGPGVPESERERIFEPFYRPASSPPDVGRAGLGLSIARRLAELQGGRLEYHPRDQGGSVLVLELPAADLPDPSL